VCTVAIAGCSTSTHRSGGSSHRGSVLAFSKCMRGHGVTSFPDPGPGGGGLNSAGTAINLSSPAFKAAQATCRERAAGSGPPAHASEQDKERFFATSRCMCNHAIDVGSPAFTRAAVACNLG
jgi:hypothetical protein